MGLNFLLHDPPPQISSFAFALTISPASIFLLLILLLPVYFLCPFFLFLYFLGFLVIYSFVFLFKTEKQLNQK